MKRTQHLAIDSKLRRIHQYPTNWEYVVSFPETFRNVTSLDLVQAFVPNTQQTVHAFNNKFQMTPVNAPTVTVTIPVGNYEPPLLLGAITQELVAAGVQNPYLSVAPDTNIVTIQADEPFTLPFATGDQAEQSIHPYLGFPNLDIPTTSQAISTYTMSLPPPAFVTVNVAEIPLAGKNRAYSMQYEIPKVYNTRPELVECMYNGLVPLDTDFQTYKFWQAAGHDVLAQQFQPIDIRQFSISLRDDKGKFFDANGYDHTLVFQITQLVPQDLPLMCPGNNRVAGSSPWGINCRI